jgi:hypothetical protein
VLCFPNAEELLVRLEEDEKIRDGDYRHLQPASMRYQAVVRSPEGRLWSIWEELRRSA